ncbi:MAG: BLUF domain-containing protein [Rubrivivax sp.]|nr:BLUF domain-containing protein [Rubrivivax sp.]
MELVHTVYVSHARADLDAKALSAILASSVRHNDAAGITGFLLHGHGLFMQVLEGEAQGVDTTMQRILADTRHARLRVLEHGPVFRREFSDWAMGFKDLGPEALASELFLPFTGRALTLEQLNLRPRYALKLLRSVADLP